MEKTKYQIWREARDALGPAPEMTPEETLAMKEEFEAMMRRDRINTVEELLVLGQIGTRASSPSIKLSKIMDNLTFYESDIFCQLASGSAVDRLVTLRSKRADLCAITKICKKLGAPDLDALISIGKQWWKWRKALNRRRFRELRHGNKIATP